MLNFLVTTNYQHKKEIIKYLIQNKKQRFADSYFQTKLLQFAIKENNQFIFEHISKHLIDQVDLGAVFQTVLNCKRFRYLPTLVNHTKDMDFLWKFLKKMPDGDD